ncbi:hypothetical protein [Ralstonia pseudosolanacearum]|uniref:hypothetical protein n=1 Tax=Ralstonia pseudosolanacearum TaxID=1310165 RepID=UPI001FFA0366|nr:hypothetical protein [Ralstonia pseudosolanacearum]
MGSFVGGLVVTLFVGLVTLGLRWVFLTWDSEAFWSAVLGEPVAPSAWAVHLRKARTHLLDCLWLREEAYVNLDGEGLDMADEWLREALHRLGGLGGAW